MAYDIIDPRRPNFTMPPAQPATPGTAMVVSQRPNWTIPGPPPAPPQMTPNMAGPDATRARAAGIRAGQPAAPAAPATPPPATTPAAGLARTIRNGFAGAKNTAGATAPALAGAGVAAIVNSARQSALDNRPAFVPPANQNAPGQIPVDPTQTGPAPIAGRFMDQTETRRNIANIAMALGGGRLAGPAAAVGLGRASTAAAAAAPAARAGLAATQGFVAGDAVSAPALATRPTATPQASYSNEGRNGIRPGPNLDGKIVRDGNSYTGTPGIKFGADVVNPDGSARSGFGVSSMDTSEGFRQNQLELARNEQARNAQLNAQNAQLAGAMEAGRTDGYGLLSRESRAERARTMDEANLPYTERMNREDNRIKAQGDQLRADVDLTNNANSNATIRANNQDTNSVTLRGQDMAAGTAKARIAADQTAASRTQANEDRRYALDVTKFGEEAAGKRSDRRIAGAKALNEEIGNMLPPGADGKPDLATAARYAEGMNAQIAEQVKAAQAELARNPNNAAAKSFLTNVEENGANAMDAVAKRRFVAGMQANEKAKAKAGNWLPWTGTDPKSAAPVSGLRMREGFIWDDYETLDAQGKVTGSIPASAVDEDRNLDILKR